MFQAAMTEWIKP